MAREILNESNAMQPAAGSEQVAANAPLSDALVSPFGGANYGDALAGAFPEWDLVPAAPFVRRVK
jgi:hypothetical protein